MRGAGLTRRVYLDANASQPLRPAAREAMLAACADAGNPSSVHGAGRAARRRLEEAREAVARCCGVASSGVIFTSGGTEADALAVHALGAGRRLVIGATEHDAIRAAAGAAALTLPVDADGRVDPGRLDALLADGPAALVCVMLANNETGVFQPILPLAAICRRRGALLHVDAVQAPAVVASLAAVAEGPHAFAISSHKAGGPAGAGALLLTESFPALPLIGGGGQERGWRGGTPALPAIAGMAAALGEGGTEEQARDGGISILRDRVEAGARGCGAVVCGAGARLGNTTCLALPGVAAQTQLIALDLAGMEISAGAACSSGRVARSHVLEAMGLGSLAGEAIRVSLPWNVQSRDIDDFVAAYAGMAARLARRVA